MSNDSNKKMSDEALKKLSKDLVDVPFNNNDDSEESYLNQNKENETDLKVFSSLNLTEQDVRNLLEIEIYFSKVTKKIQKKIQILNISSTFVHMYSLQTFVEKRQKYWQFKRYVCGRIDDYTNGQIEDVWNVKLKEKIKPFVDKSQDVIVKHSENIQPCFNCCNQPIVNCVYCGGNKWLVYYQVIKITHHSYLDEYVTEPHLIPLNKIKHASPDMLYKIEKEEVTPFKFAENKEITNASEKFIKLHKKNSKKERILLQRHQIKKIKISTVEYLYKNKFKRVFIYGNDKSREIHIPYKSSNTSFVNSLLCCLFV